MSIQDYLAKQERLLYWKPTDIFELVNARYKKVATNNLTLEENKMEEFKNQEEVLTPTPDELVEEGEVVPEPSEEKIEE